MTTQDAVQHRISRNDQALVWYLAVAVGAVFLVGAVIAALDIPQNSPAYLALYSLGLLSPFAGAMVYAWRTTGSLRPIARMYLPLRLGVGAWMILAAPLSLVAAYAVAAAFGLPLRWDTAKPASSLLLATLGWSAVMWAEETGWRGTLLPALQERMGSLAASFWVGIVWAVWHLPLLYLIDMPLSGIGYFTLQVLGLSAVMTWAYNRSRNVLVPVLIHGAGNAMGGWMLATVPTMTANELIGVQAAGPLALGLGLVLLTRGRLGEGTVALRSPGQGESRGRNRPDPSPHRALSA